MSGTALSRPARRWLTFSLRTFLVATLVLSLVLGYFGRIWLKAYRDSQPPTLYELAQIAKRHGIPMPPKGAKLVAALVNRWNDVPIYSPAFLLGELSDSSIDVLDGVGSQTLQASTDPRVPLWHDLSYASQARLYEHCNVTNDTDVLCALRLANRGDIATATSVLERFQDHERASAGIEPDLRLIVARFAWDLHVRDLTTDVQRWPEARRRLEALYDEFPRLGLECSDLLRDLAAAIDAPAPQADSTEALLIQWSHIPATLSIPDVVPSEIYTAESPDDGHALARQIVARGFDAVPDLVRLSSDMRVTAKRAWGDDPVRLGQLAKELLKELAIYNTWEERWSDGWQNPQEPGERVFFLRHAFGSNTGYADEGPLRVLAARFPEELPALCDACSRLDDPSYSRVLTRAIVVANLPSGERAALLEKLATNGSLDQRLQAFGALASFDRTRHDELLLSLLRAASDDAAVLYWKLYWNDPRSACLHYVPTYSDPVVWRAYLQVARRCPAPLRVELIKSMPWDHAAPTYRLALAFLECFLDDDSVLEPDEDGDLLQALADAADYRIKVSDYAVRQLALNLLPEDNAGHRSPEQWIALRDQFRQRLVEEELPELE